MFDVVTDRFHFGQDEKKMSFFNLTVMGYDNRFKSMKHLEPVGKDSLPNVPTGGQLQSPLEKQLAREMSGDFQSREWVSPSISNL